MIDPVANDQLGKHVVSFCGSSRPGSLNANLLNQALWALRPSSDSTDVAPEELVQMYEKLGIPPIEQGGLEGGFGHLRGVTPEFTNDVVAWPDYDFPMFSQMIEETSGVPPMVVALHHRIAAADGLLIASPEYNGGYTALLKNTIDWVTRVDQRVFGGKYVGILTASPGGGGGVRAAGQMRQLFEGMRATVHDPTFSVPNAHEVLVEPGLAPGLVDWVVGYASALNALPAAPD